MSTRNTSDAAWAGISDGFAERSPSPRPSPPGRVRYADDFVILCRSEAGAQAALAAVRAWVSEAGLTLHPEKTRIVNAAQPGGFDFLGYHFERGMKWPRKKSLGKLKDRLRAQTSRLDGRKLGDIVADVNRSLRGWYQYFQHSKASTFATVDG